MDTFDFLESEREVKFDVVGCIGIVSQLVVLVPTVLVVAHTESLVPFQSFFAPFLEPLEFGTWLYEILHFHLLELAHTENELTGNNLVAESLTYLCDTKRNLHTTGLLHIEVVDENTLCRFGTQIDGVSTFGNRT